MASAFLYRERLLPVAGAMVSLTLFWSLPVGGFRAKAVASIIGGTLGMFIGRSVWRRVRQRIYGRNRVSLYFTDTFTYVLLFAAALVTLVPRSVLHAGAALVEHPGVLTAGLSAMASAGLAMTLAGYWQMRRYELEHGPLRPKYLYASSSTGAEGMLGKQAIVRAECAPEGTVRVRNELWRARALDSASLPVGATVIVREVDGLCLLVESVSPNENRTDG